MSIKRFKSDLECIACGQLFGGLSAFDTHRVGEYNNRGPDYGRRCLTTDEMHAHRKMTMNSRGVWSRVTSFAKYTDDMPQPSPSHVEATPETATF